MSGYRRCRSPIRASAAPGTTEPRNAATDFAITLWMTGVDAPGGHCAELGSSPDGEFTQALVAWQGRNMPCVASTRKAEVVQSPDGRIDEASYRYGRLRRERIPESRSGRRILFDIPAFEDGVRSEGAP